LVRGYEHEKDRYVILSDEEIKGAAPATAHGMEILEFVPTSGIDPLCYETSYFVTPDNGADKPYALLYCALKQRQSCGIARLAMHNREHIVILRPGRTGLVLHTVFYADEIRQTDEYRTDTSMAKPKELAMADMLIDQMAASFELNKYHDSYRTNLLQLIQQKVSGSVPVSRPVAAGAPPVIDVLEALRASLDAAQQKKSRKKGASA
jgi:DNA end-binding protein Ku